MMRVAKAWRVWLGQVARCEFWGQHPQNSAMEYFDLYR